MPTAHGVVGSDGASHVTGWAARHAAAYANAIPTTGAVVAAGGDYAPRADVTAGRPPVPRHTVCTIRQCKPCVAGALPRSSASLRAGTVAAAHVGTHFAAVGGAVVRKAVTYASDGVTDTGAVAVAVARMISGAWARRYSVAVCNQARIANVANVTAVASVALTGARAEPSSVTPKCTNIRTQALGVAGEAVIVILAQGA